MKIIKKVDTKEWSLKCTCSQCDTELEAEAGDVKVTHVSGYGRDSDYDAWSVNCPVCSNTISLKQDNIPKLIRVNAKQKSSFGGPMDR